MTHRASARWNGLASAVACVAAFSSAVGQEPPIFRARADVVAVDVSVIDENGRPVTGLKAEDFTLMVDGQARRIASLEFVSHSVSDAANKADPPRGYSSNAGAIAGRLLLLLVDEGSFRPGGAREALAAAARFVDGLPAADRVGLLAIPTGTAVAFTTDRGAIKGSLQRISGTRDTAFGRYSIGLSEALDAADGDRYVVDRVIARECRSGDEGCALEVEAEVTDAGQAFAAATRQTLSALQSTIAGLARVPGAKTVVFISQGLPVSDTRDMPSLAASAAAARATLFTMHVQASLADIAGGPSPTPTADIQLQAQGLELVAGLARGALLRVVGSANAAFERIAIETSGYYLLGFEPAAPERDGKPHHIAVTVSRPRVAVRARREFLVRESSAHASPADGLGELMGAPFVATDIGVRVGTFTLRDPASSKLKVFVSANVEPGPTATAPLTLGMVVLDQRGRVAANIMQPLDTSGAMGTFHPWSGFVVLEPGRYRLRLGVMDGAGRTGSVDHEFTARLTPAGTVEAGDLVFIEEMPESGSAPQLSLELDPTIENLGAHVELYGAGEQLRNVRVRMEVAQTDGSRALVTSPARVADLGGTGRRSARALVALGLLPAGNYVARAVIEVDGREIGRVLRPFRLPPRPTRTTARPSTPTEKAKTAATISGRQEALVRFDRNLVLDPAVVSLFVGRLESVLQGAPSPALAAALEQARAGRAGALSADLRVQEQERVAAAFLNGLALFARGELEQASRQFRAAIAAESDFFPALFYLGACYAAAGRDAEAAAAWQTSLITETGAPIIYKVLGDALLRTKDAEQAVGILAEAAEQWPDDPDFALRLAGAYIATDRPKDAFAHLTRYLDRQPDDADALFLALRLLYEAHSAGTALISRDEDVQRFDRHASAYVAAGGPHQALVDEWRRALATRK